MVSIRYVVLAMVAFTAACDSGFQPIARSDHFHLSIFGYLDASADTQWIRVMPIRPLQLTSPDSIRVEVSLENLDTHQVTELRDSLLRLPRYADTAVGSTGQYVHDFWTTEKIEPGATYRFRAVRDGGDTAEAVVRIPEYYPVDVWIAQPTGYGPSHVPDRVYAVGPPHLPFLALATRYYDRCGWGMDTVWYKGAPLDDGSYESAIGRDSVDERGRCGRITVTRRRLWTVASEDPWPEAATYSAAGVGQSALASNVTHALGFIGGVLTRSVPYENCRFDYGEIQYGYEYCVLHYDKQTAGLSGKITETRCGDGPIDSVTVMVRELDRDPPKLRTVLTDPTGAYDLSGLEPGVRYMVKDSALPELDPFAGEITIYDDPVDTIEFASGEQRTTDVAMHRITYCATKPARGCPQCN